MNNEVKRIHTPLDDEVIKSLKPGDMVLLSGKIYCGRDAVLPKVCKLIKENKLGDTDINLMGNVIFHTAVSPAGVGPTSSNKLEIESSFPLLSKAGVKVHLGKGAVGKETIETVSYTHLRAHETRHDLVCRLLLEKKKKKKKNRQGRM